MNLEPARFGVGLHHFHPSTTTELTFVLLFVFRDWICDHKTGIFNPLAAIDTDKSKYRLCSGQGAVQ